MNKRTLSPVLVLSILTMGTAAWGADATVTPPPPIAPAAPPSATNGIGPKINFQMPVYDFGRARVGEQVKYSYVFTNSGDQLLEIGGVQACGCITADWTRKVEPGKTGAVPIAFNSTGYGGFVGKTITVTCNDRTNPRPMLQFKGIIWKPIDVTPPMAFLNLGPDTPQASVTVQVTNNLPEPITLSAPECDHRSFAAELKVVEPGRAFKVVVKPVPPMPAGSLQAHITLKTSSTNSPVISIPVIANVQPLVTINPPQINLPAAPLAQPQTISLNLIDNSTNRMMLSEPKVNAGGVDVQVREVVPGRNFTATLAFPQGFELPPGQPGELSIQSGLALLPAIKVRILQAPRLPAPKLPPVKRPAGTNRHRPLPPIDLPPLPP